MNEKPLTLPRIGSSEAQALQVLVRRAIHLPVKDWPASVPSPEPARLSLRWMDSSWRPQDGWLRSRLEWSGAQLSLELPSAMAEEWATVVMGASVGSPMPEHWRRYGLSHAVQWAAAALTACGRGTARVKHADATIPGMPDGLQHTFELSLEAPTSASWLRGVLRSDSLGLMMLASLLSSAPQVSDNGVDPERLPLHGYLRLGWTDLPAQSFRELACGDVVFIESRPGEQPDSLALMIPLTDGRSRGLRVSVQHPLLTIQNEAFEMRDEPDHDGAGDEPDPVLDEDSPTQPWRDGLRVRLSFDVGHRTMTLSELEHLQPGEVLNLDRPLDAAVTIRANGAAVGLGKLVDVDGRLGVQVVQLGTRT